MFVRAKRFLRMNFGKSHSTICSCLYATKRTFLMPSGSQKYYASTGEIQGRKQEQILLGKRAPQ